MGPKSFEIMFGSRYNNLFRDQTSASTTIIRTFSNPTFNSQDICDSKTSSPWIYPFKMWLNLGKNILLYIGINVDSYLDIGVILHSLGFKTATHIDLTWSKSSMVSWLPIQILPMLNVAYLQWSDENCYLSFLIHKNRKVKITIKNALYCQRKFLDLIFKQRDETIFKHCWLELHLTLPLPGTFGVLTSTLTNSVKGKRRSFGTEQSWSLVGNTNPYYYEV